ncbi:MAG: hypothetical protein F4Y62_04140 [Rhodospirillaceae bacterium]|nr:hypothetical protein [Rhodospirillaceae bacterium]
MTRFLPVCESALEGLVCRQHLVDSLAATLADYRQGQIAPIDAARIGGWVSQFPEDTHLSILAETDHVLSRTYLKQSAFESFFSNIITDAGIVGEDARAWWARSRFFTQQGLGRSQRELLALFDVALLNHCGLSYHNCGEAQGRLVYIDDAVYTGMRVLNDLTPTIAEAPAHSDIHLIVYARHNQGAAYATRELEARFRRAGKTATINWTYELDLENNEPLNSDVLWPKSVPADAETQQYQDTLTRAFLLRTGDSVGKNGFFSSGARRHLLEQEFLKAGAHIRAETDTLNEYARPLGNRVMQDFGFGALIVTYRNCPNGCPLVFWAGDHPLFERRNN